MAGYRSSEASKKVVDETKRLYTDLLSKPLDSRQLARPTFRYIQEIAKNLITETRTLRNVFNPSDFETENKTWDTRRKCDFVQRLIDFAANHEQPVVGCVAAKLVAGLDPNKTNELLQSLARIAQKRLGSGGPERNSNRPRTFTRQSPSSVSPPKQRIEGAQAAHRNQQPDSVSPRASTIKPATATNTDTARKSSSQRNVAPPKLSIVSRRGDSSSRETSASNRKSSGDGGSRRTSVQTTNQLPEYRSRNSSVAFTDSKRNDDNINDGPMGGPQVANIETPSQAQARPSSQVSKSSQSNTIDRKSQQSQDVIVSESDIGKNIQQLRSNLDHLRVNLLELSQFDVQLKTKLLAYTAGDSNKV